MDNNFTFQELQTDIKEWGLHNFPHAEPWEPLVGAMEELGELSHAHLKEHQEIRIGENYIYDKIDAIGDIIIYLADYCQRNNISLADAVYNTWQETRKRDWIKYPEKGVPNE